MGTGFAETPLAVFTTLAPMGAGAFLVLACAFFASKVDDDALVRIDKMTLLPVGVAIAGFIGAFFHLASPLHAFGVFSGIGSSPLSNEIAVGVAFMALALVYTVLAVTGKLSSAARKALVVAVAVLAVVFMAFCGLAYMMYTIPTWNTPASIVQMLGYGVMGGAALGALALGCARIEVAPRLRALVVALCATGLVIGAIGFGMQAMLAGSVSNIWGSAADSVPALWGMFAVFVACGVAATAFVFVAGRRDFAIAPSAAAFAFAVVGVFIARIAFYGLFMSVAL